MIIYIGQKEMEEIKLNIEGLTKLYIKFNRTYLNII